MSTSAPPRPSAIPSASPGDSASVPKAPPPRSRVPRGASRVPIPRRPSIRALAALLAAAVIWGWVVDTSVIPVLAPTGNSTVFQSSTAAGYALLGILFGPLMGALGGLIRDGTGYTLALALHPAAIAHMGFGGWLGRAAVDTIEDMVLGLVPGLVAARVRRVDVLALASAAAAWLSLPFLVAGDALFSGHAAHLWQALTTVAGDWNEPVDPGLTVYALLTGALVAFALARWTTRPRVSLAVGALLLGPALALIALGAHY